MRQPAVRQPVQLQTGNRDVCTAPSSSSIISDVPQQHQQPFWPSSQDKLTQSSRTSAQHTSHAPQQHSFCPQPLHAALQGDIGNPSWGHTAPITPRRSPVKSASHAPTAKLSPWSQQHQIADRTISTSTPANTTLASSAAFSRAAQSDPHWAQSGSCWAQSDPHWAWSNPPKPVEFCGPVAKQPSPLLASAVVQESQRRHQLHRLDVLLYEQQHGQSLLTSPAKLWAQRKYGHAGQAGSSTALTHATEQSQHLSSSEQSLACAALLKSWTRDGQLQTPVARAGDVVCDSPPRYETTAYNDCTEKLAGDRVKR